MIVSVIVAAAIGAIFMIAGIFIYRNNEAKLSKLADEVDELVKRATERKDKP
mgnify:CR=1 FL=1|jgi:outer membrane murein-binding lipoprotein Lpp